MKLICCRRRRFGAEDEVVYIRLCDGVHVAAGGDQIGLRTTNPGLISAIFLSLVLYYGCCFATTTPDGDEAAAAAAAAEIKEPEIEAIATEIDEPDAVDGEGVAISTIFRFTRAFFVVLAVVCMFGGIFI